MTVMTHGFDGPNGRVLPTTNWPGSTIAWPTSIESKRLLQRTICVVVARPGLFCARFVKLVWRGSVLLFWSVCGGSICAHSGTAATSRGLVGNDSRLFSAVSAAERMGPEKRPRQTWDAPTMRGVTSKHAR